MRIVVPAAAASEARVPLTPDVAERLVAAGHVVTVTVGAGSAAGFLDGDYRTAGATVVEDASTDQADLMVTIRRPARTATRAVLGLLEPFSDPAGLAALASGGATLFAFEAVPRTTRAQMVDVLSSQATAAGYRAVIEAAHASHRFFPLMTTAAGTVRPARVLVLGAGVAGLQAIATARRLGAVVSAYDVRAAAAEQVESLGARFVNVDVEAQDAAASGGYARELESDTQTRIVAALAPHVAEADVVVTAAAVPGRPAPLLVDEAGLAGMRPGSVVIDLAASTGGNTSLTEPGATVDRDGVRIIGELDLEARVAADASRMYARNVAAFVELITGDEASYAPDWDDDIVAATCVARDGSVLRTAVGE